MIRLSQAVLAAALSAIPLAVQGQTTVTAAPTTNINIQGDSDPANITQVDGKLFFTASSKAGPGLYVQSLAAAQRVAPTLLRRFSKTTDQFVTKGLSGHRQLFFHVLDSGLWTSLGTANTTVLLKQVDEVRPLEIPLSFLTSFKDLPTFSAKDARLFFAGVAPGQGYDLWSSNGTATGTKRYWHPYGDIAGDIYQVSAIPYGMVDLGGTLVFAAKDSTATAGNFFQLWATNGTVSTKAPLDPRKLTTNLALEPHELTRTGTKDAPGGRCYFSASGRSNPGMRELWFTDGQAVNSTFCATDNQNVNPVNLAAFGNGILFSGHDNSHGNELWMSKQSDPSGMTTLVADLNPGAGDSNPRTIVNAGNKFAYFIAAPDGTHDYLYRTDGTAGGTQEILPAANTLSPRTANGGHLASASGITPLLDASGNGTVFFAAADGNGNRILWATPNTAGAAALPVTTPGNSAIKNPTGMTAVSLASPQISRLYFSATVSGSEFGDKGTELWSAPPVP